MAKITAAYETVIVINTKIGEEAIKALVEKFKALINTFADDIVLEFKGTENVKINYAFRLQPEGGAIETGSPMHLGPILREAPLHVLFEFLVDPEALTGDVLTLLSGSLKISIAARPTPVPPIPCSALLHH